MRVCIWELFIVASEQEPWHWAYMMWILKTDETAFNLSRSSDLLCFVLFVSLTEHEVKVFKQCQHLRWIVTLDTFHNWSYSEKTQAGMWFSPTWFFQNWLCKKNMYVTQEAHTMKRDELSNRKGHTHLGKGNVTWKKTCSMKETL